MDYSAGGGMYGGGERYYGPPSNDLPSSSMFGNGAAQFSSSGSVPTFSQQPFAMDSSASSSQPPAAPPGPSHKKGHMTAEGWVLDEDDDVPRSSKPAPKTTSCSACRMRRVRCEKFPEDGKEHPKCMPCEAKGIECIPVVAKPRRLPNRTGKRIDLAKELFGQEQQQVSSTNKRKRIELSANSTDAQLGDNQIQGALTSAILEFFFEKGVNRLSFLDETSLINNFEAASRRTSLLDPQTSTLISVILALGARMSDHPMLVGPDAPKIEELSTTQDLSIWGRKRIGPCRALLAKAMKEIDDNAIMRTPSMESIAALMLAQGLLEHENDNQKTGDAYAAAYIGHMRYLLANEQDEEKRAILTRGELGWTAYVKDAVTSTAVGKSAIFTENDVDMLTGDSPLTLLDIFDVKNFPVQEPQRIFFDSFRAIFHEIASVARKGAYKLTGYKALKAPRLDEQALREFVNGLHLTGAALPLLEARAVEFVGPAEETGAHFTTNANMLVWGFVRTLRLSRAAQLTVPLRVISARMRGIPYSTRTKIPTIQELTPLGDIIDQVYLSEDEQYAERLHALADEAATLAFKSARELATQLELTMQSGLPLSMMAGVQMTFARTANWAKPLIDTPATEEGGPEDFSFGQKIRELGWVAKALKFSGWSFDELAKPAMWLDTEIENVRMKQALWNRAREGGTVPATIAALPATLSMLPSTLSTLPPSYVIPAAMGSMAQQMSSMPPLQSSPQLGHNAAFYPSYAGLNDQPTGSAPFATMEQSTAASNAWAMPSFTTSPSLSSGATTLSGSSGSDGFQPFSPYSFNGGATTMDSTFPNTSPTDPGVLPFPSDPSPEALQAYLNTMFAESGPLPAVGNGDLGPIDFSSFNDQSFSSMVDDIVGQSFGGGA